MIKLQVQTGRDYTYVYLEDRDGEFMNYTDWMDKDIDERRMAICEAVERAEVSIDIGTTFMVIDPPAFIKFEDDERKTSSWEKDMNDFYAATI